MNEKIQQELLSSLQKVEVNWNRMQQSNMEQAEDLADRFQSSFYAFIDVLQSWYSSLKDKPRRLEDALNVPIIRQIAKRLHGPIYLNFETELDLILEGIVRDDDDAEY